MVAVDLNRACDDTSGSAENARHKNTLEQANCTLSGACLAPPTLVPSRSSSDVPNARKQSDAALSGRSTSGPDAASARHNSPGDSSQLCTHTSGKHACNGELNWTERRTSVHSLASLHVRPHTRANLAELVVQSCAQPTLGYRFLHDANGSILRSFKRPITLVAARLASATRRVFHGTTTPLLRRLLILSSLEMNTKNSNRTELAR